MPVQQRDLAVVVTELKLSDGTEIRGFRDGLIAVRLTAPAPHMDDFDALAEHRLRVARLLNAHLACMHLRRLPMNLPQPVVPERLLHVEFASGDFRSSASHLPEQGLMLARFDPLIAGSWELKIRTQRLPKEAADEALARLDALLASDDPEAALLRAELLFRAGAAYGNHDHAGCLVNAWTVIEGLANELLDRYLDSLTDRPTGMTDAVFLNAERRRFFRGSAVTARLTAEFLSLADRLSFETYVGIRRSASARNDWLHKQAPVAPEQAVLALQTAEQLFEAVESVRLEMPLGRVLH